MNLNSHMVLDVAGSSTANGAPAIQWEWNGGTNQLWQGIVSCVDIAGK